MQTAQPLHITVSIPHQRLSLKRGRRTLKSWPISTSSRGAGTEPGSFKTPTGRFRIAEKVGDGAAPGAVFRSRVATGEFGTEEMDEDLVQTRILWLDGLQRANANTFERYIYIHGTNHESTIGIPASHGCVRMRNADVIELFERVPVGTEVRIIAGPRKLSGKSRCATRSHPPQRSRATSPERRGN